MIERYEILSADITKLAVDAIVNAANPSLLGGGGVDGAIHRAAGPGLLKECAALGGCRTGEAKLTRGYLLPAKWVIHTVGPVWRGGGCGEEILLRNCYVNSLSLAAKAGIKTIAFPSISTGAYGYPVALAAKAAVEAIADFLKEDKSLQKVTTVCFNPEAFEAYRREAEKY
jgi:O-acetyl-ADP-ribose deacetylase (regulator of RNase III)